MKMPGKKMLLPKKVVANMAIVKKTEKQIEQEANDRVMQTVAWRCSFYRANPQRFVKDYLGINLKWFQVIILWAMFHMNYVMYLAARGQGKTFLIAIYCVTRCILYPGTVIAISSKTRKQSGEILDKIQSLLIPASPYLRAEIKEREIVNNLTDGHITFLNESQIKAVAANENSRHNRANVVVIDEFRMVDPMVINTVLRKFLTVSRHPGFLDKPEYKNYPLEPNREVYASSCWYESSWAFRKTQGYCVNMMDSRRDYFLCALPYQVSIMEGLLMRKQIEDEMSESDFSELAFRMESEALWIGSGENSLYRFEDIERCRKLPYPWMPPAISSRVADKKVQIPPKRSGEIRIMSVDIALMASKKRDNDAASIFINSNVPSSGTTTRRISNIYYTENLEGMRSDALALRIRKLFDTFSCDYLAIDTRGNGLPIVDLLMGEIIDRDSGVVYPPFGCCNNPEIDERCVSKSAPKVIWSILASDSFNSQCALLLRESFKNGSLRLLQSDYACEEFLSQLTGYSKLPLEHRMDFKIPYVHTSLLVNELVNLQAEQKQNSNNIRVYEKTGMRKDRYSSLSYNIYVAKELERQLSKPKNDMETMMHMIDFRQPVLV